MIPTRADIREQAIDSIKAQMRKPDTDRYYDACADAKRLPLTPLGDALVEVTRAQAFRLVDEVENAARHTHRETLIEAAGHLGAALAYEAACPDEIIIGHVRDARELILNAIRGLR